MMKKGRKIIYCLKFQTYAIKSLCIIKHETEIQIKCQDKCISITQYQNLDLLCRLPALA